MTPSARRSLSSLIPTADELLAMDVGALGNVLLTHLKSYDGVPNNIVYQNGRLNRTNFLNMQEPQGFNQGPEYGEKQPEVNQALIEAWDWLGTQGFLIRDPTRPADWFSISRNGEKLLQQYAREAQWEKLGVDVVKRDLINGGLHFGGGPLENREAAMEWVRRKENRPPKTRAKPGYITLISESRLTELRALKPPGFDFRRLIRLCEELNIAYREECYLATAILTRGLLDHVPPVFGKTSFSEVANNYGGGGKSFKETMQHLENAARKVADAHLHMPIRKSETLPTAQQVNFAAQLDVLLGEIVRITHE